ncbi:MAG: PAS domain S-box protein [Chitinophagaceae bacterium]|nr:MAG: PAS domain S-box protein [Chitinophagaceae bacterium]
MPLSADQQPTTGMAAQQLLLILDHIGDALILTDPELFIIAWNKGAERIFGLTEAEVVGRPAPEVLRYEYLDCTEEEAASYLQTHHQWGAELRFHRADGSAVYLHSQVTMLFDAAGRCTGYVGVNRDITELYHKRAAVEQYAALLSTLNETYIVLDQDHRVLRSHLKSPVPEFYGLTCDDGDNLFDRLPPYRRPIIDESCHAAFAGDTVNYETQSPLLPGVTLSATYFPLRANSGAIHYICVVIRDVTAQKVLEYEQAKKRRAEEKLFQSRRTFQEFMEHSPMQAWIIDPEGRMHYMNPAFMERHGLTAAQRGGFVLQLLPGEAGHTLLRESQGVFQSNEVMATAQRTEVNGTDRIERVFRFPIRIGDRHMAGGWAIDITEQVSLQQQLLQVEKERSQLMVQAIIDTREEERGRLAAALRGQLSGSLADCLEQLSAVPGADAALKPVEQSLRAAISELHTLTESLDPHIVERLGLPAALQQAAGGGDFSIDIQLTDTCMRSMRPELELAFYRIVQSLSAIARPFADRYVSLRLMKFGTMYFLLFRVPQPFDLARLIEGAEWRAIDNQVAGLNGYVQASIKEIRIHIPEQE